MAHLLCECACHSRCLVENFYFGVGFTVRLALAIVCDLAKSQLSSARHRHNSVDLQLFGKTNKAKVLNTAIKEYLAVQFTIDRRLFMTEQKMRNFFGDPLSLKDSAIILSANSALDANAKNSFGTA